MNKKEKWLEINKFNAEGDTYIITGETYSIKDELKEAGFRYDPTLLWHGPDPAGYENRCVKMNVTELFEFDENGNPNMLPTAKDIVRGKANIPELNATSEWVGQPGDRIKDEEVVLVKKASFTGRYGLTNIYTFEDNNGNLYTWFTATFLNKAVNDKFKIKGTIKKHDEFRGVKTTVLTRCRVVE